MYPSAQVRNEGFEATRVPENSFTATFGYVPFGGFALHDPAHNPAGHNIHIHFVLKSLALTAPGGYARGHAGYRDALPDVARLLMPAGVNARAGLDGGEADLAAAWLAVDAWPYPRHGAPRPQPG